MPLKNICWFYQNIMLPKCLFTKMSYYKNAPLITKVSCYQNVCYQNVHYQSVLYQTVWIPAT